MTDSALPSVPRHRQLPIAVILGAHEIAPAGQPVLAVFSLSEAVRSPVYVSAGERTDPTGKSAKTCPAPPRKIFWFSEDPNQLYIRPRPVPQRGGSRSSRTRDGMRWTLMCL
jgi:hypothetical protein